MLIKQINYYTENCVRFTLNGHEVVIYLTPSRFENKKQITLALEADPEVKFEFIENIRLLDANGNERS